MKKAVAILLLSFLLFNTIGYKLLFYYQIRTADIRMQAKIETLHESDKGLFTVKIPIRLPYHTDWKDFESVEGEMTYNNTTYKYVKRKIFRDTLILLCINFPEKSVIEKNSSEYFKKVNDLTPDNSKKHDVKQAKDDFYQKPEDSAPAVYYLSKNQRFSLTGVLRTSSYHSELERPPNLMLPSA